MKLSEFEDKMDNYDPEIPSKWKVIKWIVIVFLIGAILSGLGFLWSVTIGSGAGVVRRTMQPDNVIFQYEHFHDQCRSVLAYKHQLISAQQQYESDTALPDDVFGQKVSVLGRDQSNITSIKNQIDNISQQYNSDSHKWNQSIFKSKNLPYEINPPNYVDICEQ